MNATIASSSNIECNVAVGTIFAIYKAASGAFKFVIIKPMSLSPALTVFDRVEDFMAPGRTLVAAGYVLYSSSTVMVISRAADTGVHVFNLDPTLGEYVMTRVCQITNQAISLAFMLFFCALPWYSLVFYICVAT